LLPLYIIVCSALPFRVMITAATMALSTVVMQTDPSRPVQAT
jgi:hypothetical protein